VNLITKPNILASNNASKTVEIELFNE
jgi:hypothetical protein